MNYIRKWICAAIILFAVPAVHGLTHTLVETGSGCPGGADRIFDRVWCENAWNESGVWTPSGYPDSAFDDAIIEYDNAEAGEDWLQLNLIDETIRHVTVRIKYFVVTYGWLRLAFWGDSTLICESFKIDASTLSPNDGIVVIAGGGAKIQTQDSFGGGGGPGSVE